MYLLCIYYVVQNNVCSISLFSKIQFGCFHENKLLHYLYIQVDLKIANFSHYCYYYYYYLLLY